MVFAFCSKNGISYGNGIGDTYKLTTINTVQKGTYTWSIAKWDTFNVTAK